MSLENYNIEKKEAANHWHSIRILHAAITVGAILATGVMVFIGFSQNEASMGTWEKSMDTIYKVIYFVVGCALLFISSIAFGRVIAKAKIQEGLVKKLEMYRGALIVRMAIIEGFTFASAVLYYVFHYREFIIAAAAGCIMLILMWPKKSSVANQLDIPVDDLYGV